MTPGDKTDSSIHLWVNSRGSLHFLLEALDEFVCGGECHRRECSDHSCARSEVGGGGRRGAERGGEQSCSLGGLGMPAYIQQNISNPTLMEDVPSKRRDQQIRRKLIMPRFSSNCFMKIGRALFFPSLPSPCRNSSEISGSHWSFV